MGDWRWRFRVVPHAGGAGVGRRPAQRCPHWRLGRGRGPDPVPGGARPLAARHHERLDGHHQHHRAGAADARAAAGGGAHQPLREADAAGPDREARLAGAADGRHRPRDQQPHPVHSRQHGPALRGLHRRAAHPGRRGRAPAGPAPGAARLPVLPQAGPGVAAGSERRRRSHRHHRPRAAGLRAARRGAARPGRGSRRGGPGLHAAPPQPAQALPRGPGRRSCAARRCRATEPSSSRWW